MTENATINGIIKDAFTVGDLKKVIKDVNDNTPLAVVGHYGDAHFFDSMDVHTRTAIVSARKPNGVKIVKVINVLNLDAPDIGPPPD